MKGIAFALFWLLITFVAITTVYIIDSEFYNARFTTPFIWEEDCNYKLPHRYTLQTNGDYWIIKKGDEWLTRSCDYSATFISLEDYEAYEPTYFKDTCLAKGYAKDYFRMVKEYNDSKVENNFYTK